MARAPYDLGDLNLDCMSPEDLAVTVKALRRLTEYAELKERAMNWRADGNVRLALRAEAQCEQLYTALPDNWRW